ncbi:DUF2029 domain-containing protein [Candidatus Sumerlaeota bacterium]|nr:DUF2029 domain-containing protein [Candidatus Sumerlaeota bacterium]
MTNRPLLTRRQLALLAVGLGLTLLAIWLYIPRQITLPLESERFHSNDFKHLWVGSRLLLLGESPYSERNLDLMAEGHNLGGINPYVYLPFTGLTMSPVTQMHFHRSARVWFGVSQVALLLAIALTGAHLAGRRWWHAPWMMALGILIAALMMPLYRQSTAGQLNGVLTLALVIILISLERRWDWLAGLAIAFATLLKLSPGLFILWLLWRRAWRPLAWTAGWLALLMIWSLWRVGIDTHLEFLPLLADMRIGHSTWAHRGMAFHCDPTNQAMGSFLLHILAGAGGTQPWLNLGEGVANGLTAIFTLGILGTLVFATRHGWGDAGPELAALRPEWALVVLASLLIPSLMWDHYVVQLLPVLMVLIWGIWMREGAEIPRRSLLTALWIAAAILLAVWISHTIEERRHGLGLIAMSIRLWGVLLLFGLALEGRRAAARRPAPEAQSVPMNTSPAGTGNGEVRTQR